MDILSQYKQEHPETFQEKKLPRMTDEYGREYTGMVAFVIRLSGGRIRDARTASFALAIVAGIIVLATFYLFISALRGGSSAPLPYEQTYRPLQ